MKNSIKPMIVAGIAAASVSSANAQELFAGWGFDQFIFESRSATNGADFATGSASIDASHSSSFFGGAGLGSTINWSGLDFSGSNQQVFGSTGTTSVNNSYVDSGTINMSSAAATSAVVFNDGATGTVNGGVFTINLDTTGVDLTSLTFAAASSDASGATIDWSFGGNSIGTTNVSNGGFAPQTVDLSAVSGLDNNASVQIVGTLSNFAGGTLSIDGVQISGLQGAVVPEPSTYAAIAGALALAVTGYIRRRK